MAQQDSSNKKSRNRTAAVIMLAFFSVMAVVVVIGANWYLQNSRARMLREVGQNLHVQTNNKVALLTVWSGSLIEQVEVFVELDLLRLFAAEVDSSRLPAEVLLREAQKEGKGLSRPDPFADEQSAEAQEDAARAADPISTSDPLSGLAPRLPMMVRQLKDFIDKNSFWAAYLVNADLEIYMSPGTPPVLTEAQRAFLEKAFKTGQPVFMPVRRQNGELVMDMAFPIKAPLYVDSSGDKVVSVLLASYNVLPVVKAVTRHSGGKEYSAAILQNFSEHLQRIDPTVREGFVDLPGWKLEAGRLPLEMRNEPGPGGTEDEVNYTQA